MHPPHVMLRPQTSKRFRRYPSLSISGSGIGGKTAQYREFKLTYHETPEASKTCGGPYMTTRPSAFAPRAGSSISRGNQADSPHRIEQADIYTRMVRLLCQQHSGVRWPRPGSSSP